jgi:hypothetical protein
MSWKEWLLVAVVLGGLVAYLVIRMVGGDGSSTSTAKGTLSQPVMATAINQTTAEPTEPTDTFPPDTPIIYCTVKLSNPSPNTEVKARWIYVGDASTAKNKLLNETKGKFTGTRFLSFSLTNDEKWAVGSYNVELYLAGKKVLTVPFTVQ